MAAIAEQSHDERGLIWPPAVAPYDVWITPIGEAALVAADELAATLTAEGLAVVVDDRDSSPGVRFADADLIGVPHRVTIGKRLEKDGVISIKRRGGGDEVDVPFGDVVQHLLDQTL
jgi:prolyl-tRNA synthetase